MASASAMLIGEDFCSAVESGPRCREGVGMALTVVGINHRGATLEIRERARLPDE